MVCAKCQKLQKKTELVTPGVKRKSDLYYGSPASSTAGSRVSITFGSAGIGKVSASVRERVLTLVRPTELLWPCPE